MRAGEHGAGYMGTGSLGKEERVAWEIIGDVEGSWAGLGWAVANGQSMWGRCGVCGGRWRQLDQARWSMHGRAATPRFYQTRGDAGQFARD